MSFIILLILHIIRSAYIRLLDKLDRIDTNVATTKEDVRRIADFILNKSPDRNSGTAMTDEIPLEPKEEDYLHLNHWAQGSYKKNGNGSKDLNSNSGPTISSYMEDQNAKPISSGVKSKLRGDLFSYWTGLLTNGKRITNWTDLDLDLKEEFRDRFEKAYPWLRLCEAHWKVDHLWINYYASWKKSRLSPGPDPALDLKPSIDVTSSTEESNISTGSKRGREEPENSIEDPPKRYKGGFKAITPTKFHHSLPLTKKLSAKLAKVCQPCFLFTLRLT